MSVGRKELQLVQRAGECADYHFVCANTCLWRILQRYHLLLHFFIFIFVSVGIGNCCITVKFTLCYSLFWKHLGKLDHFRFPISEFHCNINHHNTSDTLGRSWKFDESLCLMEFVSCLRLNSFFFYNRFYIWTYVQRSLIHLRKFKVKVRLLLKKIPAKYPDNQTVRCRCLRRSTS